MCFTSGAPSHTRANVSICMHVCVCQNRSAACLYNLLSAFNLPSAGKGSTGKKREDRRSARESDNHSVREDRHKVVPLLLRPPITHFVLQGSFAYSLPWGRAGTRNQELSTLVCMRLCVI